MDLEIIFKHMFWFRFGSLESFELNYFKMYKNILFVSLKFKNWISRLDCLYSCRIWDLKSKQNMRVFYTYSGEKSAFINVQAIKKTVNQ
jgi:hypothetical protein